jgi:chemotaxis protein methyltransferase CheR
MNDADGIAFLQWSLPRLGLRWRGFRRVRRLVYRRLEERLLQLRLPDLAAYRSYLEAHPTEWAVLDALCLVPISRFYRDRAVFEFLETEVLPGLADRARDRGERALRCWSIGCGAGEEVYTLAAVWRRRVAARFPSVSIRVLGIDADPEMVQRAERGWYPDHALKDLPVDLRDAVLARGPDGFGVRDEARVGIEFQVQDVRRGMPAGPFHLVLCRYVVFTYFEEALQRRVLDAIVARLADQGALVLGVTESLPAAAPGLTPWSARLRVYRRADGAAMTGPPGIRRGVAPDHVPLGGGERSPHGGH